MYLQENKLKEYIDISIELNDIYGNKKNQNK